VQVGGEDDAAELDAVAILEAAIDMERFEAGGGVIAETEVGFAAGFEEVGVGLGDHDLGVGEALELGEAGDVIEMAVGGGEDFDVRELEAELLDARLDLGDGFGEACVDEDMALRSGDEVGGQIPGADPVDVGDDAEGRKGFDPFGVGEGRGGLGKGAGEENGKGGEGKAHQRQYTPRG